MSTEPSHRPPGRRSGGTTLATRIALACLVVALLAALTAALSSSRLTSSATRESTRSALAAQADALATSLADVPVADLRRQAVALLDGGTTSARLVVVGPDGSLNGPAEAVAAATRAGLDRGPGSLSRWVLLDRRTVAVEARPVGAGGFALIEAVPAGVRTSLVRAVLLASLIGLLGAGIAGTALAGVLSRPLRRMAETARRLRNGERGLRVPVEGPRELADVAVSVNELAASLEESEQRRRSLLMSVSHELRTPLTAVRGFAESIADGVTTGAEAERAAATIVAEAARLDVLVGDLLDLARLDADELHLEPVRVDLDTLLSDAARVWSARAGARDVGLVVHGAPGLVVVTDPRRLRQVIDNLAENALRVTPAGRPLVLALSEVPGGARLQVRDGGPGLAPDEYAVAFQRGLLHARYRHDRGGTSGIGLALVHSLVTRLGGSIEAGPAPEGGAAFTIDLPTDGPAQPSG